MMITKIPFLLWGLLSFSQISFTQIQLLNDEFNNAATLAANWNNINDTEAWNAEQLEVHDIHTTTADHLRMMPWTSVWFEDYRGTLLYKMVDLDFVFTTEVIAANRAANDIPGAQFSLAGVMIRTPRNYPNGATGAGGWTPGGENYIFLSTGFASMGHPSCPGCPGPHFEVKNTINSNSNLEVSSIATSSQVKIRLARIGEAIIVLYQLPGQSWLVHRRFFRNDFPSNIQVGLVTYTDWSKASTYSEFFQNSHVLNDDLNPDPSSNPGQPFDPDLIADFDYSRFDSVEVPLSLAGVDLVTEATDMELLAFLGYDTSPYCPNQLHVNSPISNGQIALAMASEDLTADNVIDLAADVEYYGGNSVELLPNFEVGLGAEFLAEVGVCNL